MLANRESVGLVIVGFCTILFLAGLGRRSCAVLSRRWEGHCGRVLVVTCFLDAAWRLHIAAPWNHRVCSGVAPCTQQANS